MNDITHSDDHIFNNNRPIEKIVPPSEAAQARAFGVEIAGDRNMEKAWQLTNTYSQTRLLMTYLGDSGTGKEPFARAVHQLRGQGKKQGEKHPLVIVNCAGLNDGVLHSEFFGHSKGAFTSADSDRKGAFEKADDGTIFLDEIGDMSNSQQAALLRVLDNKPIQKVGTNSDLSLNVKIVCATNQNLDDLVRKGRFRNDLYQRLRACEIRLPTLAERHPDHRTALVRFLTARLPVNDSDTPPVVTADAISFLLEQQFPGNVRELQQLLERAYHLARSKQSTSEVTITQQELQEATYSSSMGKGANLRFTPYRHIEVGPAEGDETGQNVTIRVHLPLHTSITEIRGDITDVLLRAAYDQADGNMSEAARIMRISRQSGQAIMRRIRNSPIDGQGRQES